MGQGHGLARPGDAQERLVLVAPLEPRRELGDGLGLVAGGRERRDNFELVHRGNIAVPGFVRERGRYPAGSPGKDGGPGLGLGGEQHRTTPAVFRVLRPSVVNRRRAPTLRAPRRTPRTRRCTGRRRPRYAAPTGSTAPRRRGS